MLLLYNYCCYYYYITWEYFIIIIIIVIALIAFAIRQLIGGMIVNVDHHSQISPKKENQRKKSKQILVVVCCVCHPTMCSMNLNINHLQTSIILLEPQSRHCGSEGVNPFRTAVPFWGQSTWSLTGLSPKRGCGSKGVKTLGGN